MFVNASIYIGSKTYNESNFQRFKMHLWRTLVVICALNPFRLLNSMCPCACTKRGKHDIFHEI